MLLTIRDNGIGIPEEFDHWETSTLGMHIIKIPSSQLEATYNFEYTSKGTPFTLKFKKAEIRKEIL